VHPGGLPDSLTWTWDPVNLNDVDGRSSVTIYSNGNAHWVSHMHDHILVEFNWELGWVLVDADGTAVTLVRSGTVGPNWSGVGGSTNDNDVDDTVFNAVIRDNWRAWVAWNYVHAVAYNGVNIPFIGGVIQELVQIAEQVYPVLAAIISVL
jgi:hypothetical protein